ncbi:hypothetical protein L5515_002480 [Caenorhabditis briggsae]|uniref:DUF7154 domain-containing protein n=1 Tax=Caenorhabditis briggsae TaxID=6238 RepID=A0AAE9J541_CAEBR|nr:hypothetical protein L5515_002480 [Caenorhabditis briggsae]
MSRVFIDDPPAYIEEDIIKPPVEIRGPLDATAFEPVERQRHFGILTYTVNDRFKKMMIILVIILVLLAAIVITLLVVLLHHRGSEDIPRCSPSPPPNPPYLFAYSNDLSPNVVSLTADTFFDALDKDGSSYATVRFDTSPEDPVYFAPDTSSVHSIVNGRLPNPALSFKTTAIGSDIIKTIERYYTSAVQHGFSTCGAIIVILLKRLPTETDISDIVAKIRANSGLVLVLTSTSPSGGDQPKTAYRIASKTNGMGIFVDDAKLRQHIDRAPIFGVRPIYRANVQVSDLDFYQLPNFNVPRNVPRLNRVSFTVQDHGPIDSFQRLELKFSDITNATLVTKIAVEAEDVRKLGSTGFSTWLGFVAGDEYRTEIDCDYTSDDIEELQIRVQTYEPFWIPYCD